MRKNNYLGFDIGGTFIKYGVVDQYANIIEFDQVATPNSGEQILIKLQQLYDFYKESYNIKGVGVSVPGIVKDGYLETAGAISDFYEFSLQDALSQRLSLDVSVENDANCALLAETWNGNAKQLKNVVSYVIGTGIGGSILLNGDLYYGSNYRAGEFGFELKDDAFITNARKASLTMNASVHTGLTEVYHNKTNEYLNGKEIYDMLEDGDPEVAKMIEQFEQNISISIYNSIVAFDPQVVLIGGAISQNENFISSLNKNVDKLRMSHSELRKIKFPKIKANKYNNSSGVVGSVYSLLKKNRDII